MAYRLKIKNADGSLREFDVPETGLSIGRSDQNDLVLPDGLLSRRHCKLYFSDGALFVSDLATVNGTIVNGRTISDDVKLSAGDVLQLGDTFIDIVTASGAAGAAAPAPVLKPDSERARTAGPAIADLGLSGEKDTVKPSRKLLGGVIAGAVSLVLVAFVIKVLLTPSVPVAETAPEKPVAPLSFSYEKTEGSAESVFRYEMELDEAGVLTVRIDDLAEDRHVSKSTDTAISSADRNELARKFERAGLFSMDAVNEGIPRQNQWSSRRISAVVAGRAVTVSVRNRLPVDGFAELCEALETYGRNEFGLWAFALSRSALLDMADEAIEKADRLYAEKDVQDDNLFGAYRSYSSAVAYLESLEPKPEIFDIAVEGRDKTAEELDKLVSDCNWRADHAINTKDWLAAESALQQLLRYVPDRTDPRYQAAEKRLLDVSRRLKTK